MKKRRFYLLSVIYIIITVLNFRLNILNDNSNILSALSLEQLSLFSDNKAFVFAFSILVQLVIVITLVFIESIVICVLRSKIGKNKLRFESAQFSVLAGNIAVTVYNMIFLLMFHFNSISALKSFNLLPLGTALKTLVIYKLLTKECPESTLRTFFKEMIIFFILEYAYSVIGYFII